MQSAEIELKFPVADPNRLQSVLTRLGFHLDTPRTFEQNTLYDTPERSLRGTRQILRIRRYGDLWTLTHKRLPEPTTSPNESRYKIRIETETHVDDGPALGAIFEQLGYSPAFRYEKYRSEWSCTIPPAASELPNATPPGEVSVGHLVIDETPIGTFAELEGPMAWIDRTLEQLHIAPESCLTESYGKLFLAWKARTGSSAENLTFDEIPAAEPALP